MKRIFKSTRTGGCAICAAYPWMSHNCMFEDNNAHLITSGIDPATGQVFNHYLAAQAAKRDEEVRRMLKEDLARRAIRPKLSELVVPSYNRISKILSTPINTPMKPLRRDLPLLR